MMKPHDLQTRHEEIKGLIGSNQLRSACNRLLDFAKDFNKARQNEALGHKAHFTELNDKGRAEGGDITNQLRKFRLDLLKFLDIVYEEANSEPLETIKEEAPKSKPKDKEEQDKQKQHLKGHSSEEKRYKEPSNSPKDNSIVFEAKGITKIYKNSPVAFRLHPLDLTLRKGEITALVGENGNGKTTLLRIIAGQLTHTEGTTAYPFLPDKGKTRDWYGIKAQIAYIPQSLTTWDGLLANHLHFSAAARGIYGQDNDDAVNYILSRLGLEQYRKASWGEISGGYRMRFELAKFLIWSPTLVLLDEPLANLDVNTQQLFLQDLRELTNSATHPLSVVISSQHLHEVESIADNIIFLQAGKPLYNGKMQDFGKDRKENSFEFACNTPQERLYEILETFDYNRLEYNGQSYIIHTPRNITKEEFIYFLLQKKVDIKFFRDISTSTRKLFPSQLS